VITLLTFRLTDSAAETDFLEADARMQEDFAYQQPGLLRRTTAKNLDGEWLILELWDSKEAVDGAEVRGREDPVAQEFMAFVDRSTMRTSRYVER